MTTEFTGDKKTVLVAESSKTLSKFICTALAKEGYNGVSFSDGLEALNFALKSKPNCIITDRVLPTIDGVQLCSVLKDGSTHNNIPVILFSAEDKVADFWTDTSGANKIFSLSIDNMDELMNSVNELIGNDDVDIDIFTESEKEEKPEADDENLTTLSAIKAMERSKFFYNMLKCVFDLSGSVQNLDALAEKILETLYKLCDYDAATLIFKDNPTRLYYTGLEEMNYADAHSFRQVCRTDFESSQTGFSGTVYEKHLVAGIVEKPKAAAKFSSYRSFPIVPAGREECIGTIHIASTKKRFFSYKVTSSVQFFAQKIVTMLNEALQYKAMFMSESRMRSAFSKFVPEEIIDDMIKSETKEKETINEKRKVAILICDIRNFTTISECNQPENVVEFLNQYFSRMVDVIKKHGGTVDKFMGDAVMALFGAPISYVDNAERAVKAAMEMSSLVQDMPCSLLDKTDGMKLDIGIGIHYGEVIVGNIGCKDKTDYTVIGDSANLASRLEGLTKKYGSRIIVSQAVRDEIKEGFNMLHVDNVRVKGKNLVVQVYRADEHPLPEDYSSNYEKGLNLYIDGAWTLAMKYFEEAAAIIPNDKAASLMIERCREFADNPPENWNGAISLTSK